MLRRFIDLSITAKIILVFAVLVMLSIVGTAVSFTSTQTLTKSEEKLEEATGVSELFEDAIRLLITQREGFLYLLISNDREYFSIFSELSGEVDGKVSELEMAVKGDSELENIVIEIKGLINTWHTDYADRQMELMRHYLTVNQARAIEASGDPASIFKSINVQETAFRNVQQEIRRAAMLDAEDAKSLVNIVALATSVIFVILSILTAFLFSKLIAAPLVEMTSAMRQLADGVLDVIVPGKGRGDELGGMAQALDVFRANAVERKKLEEETEVLRAQQAEEEKQRVEEERQRLDAEMAQQQAELERRERLTNERNALIAEFEEQVKEALATAEQEISSLQHTSNQLATTADSTQTRAQSVRDMSGSSAENVQTVAAATEELGASVQEISSQVSRSNVRSQEADGLADQAGETVKVLEDGAEAIGQVLDLISDIAEQTNLLALNATIEAARAGDAGKGFSVVASEVKNLATQTAKATEEITSQVNDIRSQTSSVSKSMGAIKNAISELTEMMTAIAGAIEEQQAATQEISRNVQDASSRSQDVNNEITGVTEGVESTRDASGGVGTAATTLAAAMKSLHSVTTGFLSKVASQET
jgi:methyl-accepting chemotaxis protein